jgi:hypothetical protein
MKTIFAAGALIALPLAAEAGPIDTATAEPHVVVQVQYWGSVYGVDGQRTGEKVSGTAWIRTWLAPPDSGASDQYGRYLYGVGCSGSDCAPGAFGPSGFVTDDHATLARSDRSEDHVFVLDRDPYTRAHWDRLLLSNTETQPGATPADSTRWDLSLEVGSPLDFVHGDGLAQTFDLRVENAGHDSGHGGYYRMARGATQLVSFFVDRLKVTPKVCHS